MSDTPRTSKVAQEAAEKVLVTLYGEDLIGCRTNPDVITAIIQEAVAKEARDYRELSEALIGALRQIQVVATPPDKSEVLSSEDLIATLGRRADAIRDITAKILQAWDKL